MAFEIEETLRAVADGSLAVDEASRIVGAALDQAQGYVDLGFARADVARARRQGAGEVIYGEGKTAHQIARIVRALEGGGQPRVLITRLDADKARDVSALLSGAGARVGVDAACEGAGAVRAGAGDVVAGTGDVAAGSNVASSNVAGAAGDAVAAAGGRAGARAGEDAMCNARFTYYPDARLAVVGGMPDPDGDGVVVVAAAGTSDVAVAEEAALTLQFLGNETVRLFDVGVAGIHRLLLCEGELSRARVVVAVAGMEGALASVVGGMVACPVIAVPTSVGYGASFGGVAALLAMLNSCASGVSVVNIDNGFGAGYQASLINHLSSRA